MHNPKRAIVWQLSLRFLSSQDLLRNVQLVSKDLHELCHSGFQIHDRWSSVKGTLVQWHRRSCARCDKMDVPMCSMHLHCVRPSTHTLCLSCINDIAGQRLRQPCMYMYKRAYCQECFAPLKVKNRCPDKHCMYTVCTPCLLKFHRACPVCHHSFRRLRPKARLKTPAVHIGERLLHHSNCPCISAIFVVVLCGLGYMQCTLYYVPIFCKDEDVVHMVLLGYLVFLGLVCGSNIVFLVGKSAYHGCKTMVQPFL